MSALSQISVAIICKDAVATLARTLNSTQTFGEVVIYDNGSTDGSQAVAQRYANVTLLEGAFLGFGPSKQKAIEAARNDWVLVLDADEAVSPALLQELNQLVLADPHVAYELDRHNFLMGKHVAHSGWGGDWLIRLINRTCHGMNSAQVHEQIEKNQQSKVQKLQHPIEHLAVLHLGQFLEKTNRYSEIRRQTGSKKSSSAWLIVLRAIWAFWRTLIFRGGLLDGWRGVVIAWGEANGVFYKYMKIYADKAVERELSH